MATRRKLNAPRGQPPTRLQVSQALILSAPVLDRLEVRRREPRWEPSLEVRLVPWWEEWPARVSGEAPVMLPAKPRIRLSKNSTGRTSIKLALITSQVEPLIITSLPIGMGGRTRRNQNSRRRASMKLNLSSISDGLPSPSRLLARPGSIPKNQLETLGTGRAAARLSAEKQGGKNVYRSRGHSCGRLAPRIYDVSRCRFRDPPSLGRRHHFGDRTFREWRGHADRPGKQPPHSPIDGRGGVMPGLEISARAFLFSLRF